MRRSARHLLAWLAVLALETAGTPARAQDRTAWMAEARWGVMTHYLAEWIGRTEGAGQPMTAEEWNRLVDRFDVEGLSRQLREVKAGYLIFTIGQNSGFYCAPNAAYDAIVKATPSKCARRDLVADLSRALRAQGIRLIVYLPSGAPNGDRAAVEALGWKNGAHRNREFQLRWEHVIREWSERWGRQVDGWWFDGCYWPNTMYRLAQPPNFESFAAAARAGNPESVVAFNPGVVDRILSVTPFEDYTAGEINQLDRLMIRRAASGKVDGARVHVLSYLGETWGKGQPRLTEEEGAAWTRKIVRAGGVMTWDVPVGPDGLIRPAFLPRLGAIGAAMAPK